MKTDLLVFAKAKPYTRTLVIWEMIVNMWDFLSTLWRMIVRSLNLLVVPHDFCRRLELGLGRLQLVTRRAPQGRVPLGALKPSLNLILSPKPRHDLLYFNIFRLIITFTSASCTSRPYSFISQALLLHSPPSPTPSRPACSAPTSWLRSAWQVA